MLNSYMHKKCDQSLKTCMPSVRIIPYIANRSRWKSFADAWVNLNSLENFRGVLTSLNYKRISMLMHVHNCNAFHQSFSSEVGLRVPYKIPLTVRKRKSACQVLPTESIACTIDRISRSHASISIYMPDHFSFL